MTRAASTRAASVALVLVAAAASACSRPPHQTGDRPNVLWIVWDTVRADHLSLYGYERKTAPFLERWAAQARVFDDCRSQAGSTTPSHASMFTGLLPSEHGTFHTSRMLPDRLDTIAELLHAAGYQTYLFAANPHISDKQNFQQGFDVEEHPWDEKYRDEAIRIIRTKVPAGDLSSDLPAKLESGKLKPWNIKAAGELTETGLSEWLGRRDPGRPWFAFLNYMEAHIPYVPPRPLREKMMSPAEVEHSYEIDNRPFARWAYNFGLFEYSPEDLAVLGKVYDATLLELDGMLAKLLGDLEAAGDLDDTVVILAADHGEHLGEHHLLDHQFALYEPLLRVPLVVHYPKRFAPGRDRSPVMLFDLFPTVLELCGVTPPAGLQSKARSLLHPRDAGPRLAEYPAPFGPALQTVSGMYPDWDPAPWKRRMRAFYLGNRKLICATDGRHELYDVAADPGEERDLYDASAAESREMMADLLAYTRSLVAGEEAAHSGAPSAEERKRLEGLGYLGGGDGGDDLDTRDPGTGCGF